ncbi:MAG: Glu-tRNA(Gln) amidotransferase subunit GatE [Candidatus Hodarchaeales archaeon]
MKNQSTYDYEKIGLRVGVEIHAQLSSNRKLFCHCKPNLIDPNNVPDYHFERRFRPVLGEMGTFDAGMLVEFEKSYRVIYETYGDTICTYEMDETPPFYPDFEAIKVGYIIGNFFNCQSTVDEVIFNRKQYLDGSIPTGFQRTAIIARDGFIRLKNGKKIRINNVLVEEDAARRVRYVDRADRTVYFNLDRLGIPLTEIITNHEDCHNPNELMETAFLIGLALRVLGVAKRGIGSVRQDVNVSITGGDRVELKGIQNIKDMKNYIDREITRQLALIRIKEILRSRDVVENDFQPNFIDVSSAILEELPNEVAFAIRLPKCAGIFLMEVQPEKTFAEEIFDRCELITGISMENMTHSNESSKWLDYERVSEVMNLIEYDSFVVIKGEQKSVLHALNRLMERMKQALKEVPQETRRVNTETGNSEFLRVIHGRDRMYSDTDTPPISIPNDVRTIKNEDIDVTPWDIFADYPINIFELKFIIKRGFYTAFTNLLTKNTDKTRTIIGLIQNSFDIINRKELDIEVLWNNGFEEVLNDIVEKQISKNSLEEILNHLKDTHSYKEIRTKFIGKMGKIPEDQVRKIKAVLLETNDSLDLPLGKIFRIINTHFPMLSSEQVIATLVEQDLVKIDEMTR